MNWPSGPNSRSCAAEAAYAGPVVLPREKTNTCFFEFTATPVTSPRYRSLGSFRKSISPSYGMTGTCANAVDHTSTNKPTHQAFIFSSDDCCGAAGRDRVRRLRAQEYSSDARHRSPKTAMPVSGSECVGQALLASAMSRAPLDQHRV